MWLEDSTRARLAAQHVPCVWVVREAASVAS